VVEDLGLGQHPALVHEQEAQQVELGGRQRHVLARPGDEVGVVVEDQVGAAQDRSGAGGPGAAQDGLDAGHELLEAERLDQVVVTAGAEPPHLVVGAVPGCEEDDGRAAVLLAPAAAHLEAVEVGQHDVEDDQVGLDDLGGVDGLPPARDGVDLVPRVAQRSLEHEPQVVLVVDEQKPFATHDTQRDGPS
jgi:hypothetical protein